MARNCAYLCLAILALVLTVATAASGRTWRVPGDAATIQGGIDSASAGDTVLVAPGSYTEAPKSTSWGTSMLVVKQGINLIGQAGMYQTTLDAQGQCRVIFCGGAGSGTLIRGFKITGGVGYAFGGGIYCEGSAPTIEQSWIVGNGSHSGGGIAAGSNASPTIRENVIEGNTTQGASGGGIICIYGGYSQIYDNVVRNNYADHVGGGVFIYVGCEALVRRNWIENNRAANQGGGLEGNVSDIEVSENVFLNNEATWGGGAQVGESGSAIFTLNTFVGNQASYGAGVSLLPINESPCNVTFNGNIVAQNIGGGIYYGGGPLSHECNDSWGNTGGDFVGLSPSVSDFSDDPLFCNAATHDFSLQACSPCADRVGCGQIGAYGVGCPCGGVSTEPTTWGAIKSMYR